MKKNILYVLLYLIVIVSANLLISHFGKSAVYWVSLLLIGFDLTARDRLHEAWQMQGLVWKMGLLIFIGSLLTWGINKDAEQIAKASMIAFACAAGADTIIYQLLHKYGYFVKVNGSNIVSAAIDSLVFPTIAFGGFLPIITFGQFMAKVVGGAVWAWAIRKMK